MPSRALYPATFIKYCGGIACDVIGQFEFIIKEIKNASECIVELYKQAGTFKNTREVYREARGAH